jgi:phosphoglycerate dehydrogenase-like enzyme
MGVFAASRRVVPLAALAWSACSSPQRFAGADAALAPQAALDAAPELGSTRGSRVARAMPDGPLPVTFFAGQLAGAEETALAELVPNLRIVSGLTRAEALARAGEADGIDARYATPEFLERAPNLVWVQAMSAGVDRYMGLAGLIENDAILFTNLRGVHGPAIADHAFAMLLALTRDLRFHAANQARGVWARAGSGTRPIALQGRTLLVVGLGGIGSEVARRGHGFGMRVLATRRSAAPAPDFVERVGRADELFAFLPEADVVAVCVPLTSETERLFDARAFAAMKRGAYLVNVGRGRVVDSDALLAALRSGNLAGACLDVTDPEPLPADHALWREPGVLITPHVSAEAELTDERAAALLYENLRRFASAEPLLNVVDKRAGY